MEVDVAPKIDIFDKINSIPLDDAPGDIVFTAAKKKKKKKKQKQCRWTKGCFPVTRFSYARVRT